MKIKKYFHSIAQITPQFIVLLSVLTSNVFVPSMAIAEEISDLQSTNTHLEEEIPIDESEDILEDGISTSIYEEEDTEPEVEPEVIEEPIEEVIEEGEMVEEVEEIPVEELKKPEVEKPIQKVWITDGSIATTAQPIVLDRRYISPQNEDVTVTFTKLPDNPGYLTIEEVTLTDKEVVATNAISRVAYDITTDMEDGTFEYDLTLPEYKENVKVLYSENRNALLDTIQEVENEIVNEDGNIKIEDLDHFTLFIPVEGAELRVSGSLDGEVQVTVNLEQSIRVDLEVEGDSGDVWKSSSWQVEGGSINCIDHNDITVSGTTVNNSFDITGPSTNGTYDVSFVAYTDDTCSLGASNTLTLTDGIIVDDTFTPPNVALEYDSTDPIALSSLTGIWTSVNGGLYVTGVDSNEVRWGSGSYGKSGLRFDSSGLQSFDTGDNFYLGALTHFNFPIQYAASGATLKITLEFEKPNVSPNPEFSFYFNIEETTNTHNLNQCLSWQESNTPCDDRITFPSIDETASFEIGDILYTLKIEGFVDSYPSGDPVSSFITEEYKANTAFLVGSLSSVLIEEPAISIKKKTNNVDVTGLPSPNLYVGDPVTWQYIVQNTGNVELTGISVTDDPSTTISCPETSLDPGEDMTCTASGTVIEGQFANTATVIGTHSTGTVTANDTSWYTGIEKSHLIVQKTTVPSSDPASFAIAISTIDGTVFENVNGTISDSTDYDYTVSAGTYSITETVPAGWTKTDDTCQDVVVGIGETKYCTITNTKNTGNLIVKKIINNNYGGTLTYSNFSFKINNGNDISFESDGQNDIEVNTGTYSVVENSETGYQTTYDNCTDILIGPGETETCTITNSDIQPKLTVTKNVVGGTKVVNDFELFVGSTEVTSGVQNGFNVGTYTVSETPDSDYTAGIGGDCASDGSITLNPGDVKACTITNTRNTGSLQVIKTVDYGEVTDWWFSLDGGDPIQVDSNGLVDFGQVTTNEDHTIVESGPLGTFYLSSITGTNCTPNIGNNSATATVSNSATTTCTFSNLVNKGSITILKDSIPNDPQDFSFITTGNGLSNFQLDDDDDDDLTLSNTQTFSSLLPGTYTINEVNPTAGWDFTKVECTSNQSLNTLTFDNTISLDLHPGENITCKFTNTKKGQIIVEKQTLPDASEQSFEFDSSWSIDNFNLTDDNQNYSGWLTPGSYSVSEEAITGWHSVSSCISSIGDTENASALDLTAGETITCIFTNSELSIDVEKTANPTSVPETGGNVEFTLRIDNPSAVDVNLTSLSDDIFGDLNGKGTCSVPQTISTGEYYECKFTQNLSGNAGQSHTNIVTAIASEVVATADATVTYTDVLPDITVTKTADPDSIPETGGNVTYTYTVTNNSLEDAEITVLSDNPFGTLTGDTDCQVGTVLGNGASCSFEETFTVPAGDVPGTHVNTFSATVTDGDDNFDTATADATVTYTDVLPTVTIDKQVDDNEKPEPGGDFNYTLIITNTSPEEVEITELTDSYDLPSECTDLIGTVLAANGDGDEDEVSCTYTKTYTDAGTYDNTASVTVKDNEQNTASDSDSESVKVLGAHIQFTQTEAINSILDPHTFTVEIMENPGDGWITASGELVTFSLENNSANAYFVDDINTCTTNASGLCSITINSNNAGSVEVHATSDIEVLTYTLHRETDGTLGSSVNATKNYIAGSITICKLILTPEGEITDGSELLNYNFSISGLDVTTSQGAPVGVLPETTFSTPLTLGENNLQCQTYTDLPIGHYYYSEETYSEPWDTPLYNDQNTDWTQAIPYSGELFDDDDNDNQRDIIGDGDILLTLSNPNRTLLVVNQYPYGDIHGFKWDDINGDGYYNEGSELLIGDWTINLYRWIDEEFQIAPYRTLKTDDSEGEDYGWYLFEDLLPGKYKVCEAQQESWEQTFPINDDDNCHIVNLPDTQHDETQYEQNSVFEYSYNFGNYELSTLVVRKVVLGRDHRGSIGDEIYSDDIFQVYFEGTEETKDIKDSEEEVEARFENMGPDSYILTELPVQDGYRFAGCYPEDYSFDTDQLRNPEFMPPITNIRIDSGDEVTYVCYNDTIKPELEIIKTNDTGGLGLYAGDIVTYTIVVSTPNVEDDGGTYVLKNVKVEDIIPDGFEYISGSWTGTTTEPVYEGNNPAIWSIGDMIEGDIRVLTYKVTISETQDPGTYDDLAYTYADTLLTGGSILGVSIINPETPFVGTQVTVVSEPEIEEGEVLGASTTVELPATGASSYLTLGALITMIIGSLLLLINPKKKLGNLILAGALLLGVFSIFNPKPIYAEEEEDPKVNIQIEQPATPTDLTNFKIGYVSLAIPSNTWLEIKCYEETYGRFGPVNTTTKSGSCVVDETIITESGTYKFYVTATLEGEATPIATSDIVTVEVILDKPQSVTDYNKDEGTCSYILTFNTADDGRTSKVQIFRSDKQPFTANSSTLIDEITVGPNQDVTYTDDNLPSCDKEYYYAIRAVDDLNNTSPFTTDDIVTVIEVETPVQQIAVDTTPEQGEVAGEETDGTGAGEEETDENGEVAGEETENGEQVDGEDTEDGEEGEGDEEEKTFWQRYWYVILASGVILAVALGYTYVRRKE